MRGGTGRRGEVARAPGVSGAACSLFVYVAHVLDQANRCQAKTHGHLARISSDLTLSRPNPDSVFLRALTTLAVAALCFWPSNLFLEGPSPPAAIQVLIPAAPTSPPPPPRPRQPPVCDRRRVTTLTTRSAHPLLAADSDPGARI